MLVIAKIGLSGESCALKSQQLFANADLPLKSCRWCHRQMLVWDPPFERNTDHFIHVGREGFPEWHQLAPPWLVGECGGAPPLH